MLDVIESTQYIFDIVAKYGVTYTQAYLIANAINAGLSLASILSIVSGVGSIIGASINLIRKNIWELSLNRAIMW